MTQTQITIEVHTICWNEERLLPLFLNHYAQFATRIIVWDNGSDDASPELVRRCPRAELRTYDSGGQSSEDRYLDVKNHCWKESRSDWVIVCDVDELIHHEDLPAFLAGSQDAILRCDGFNVCGPLTTDRAGLDDWRGKCAPWYCKPAVFRASIGEMRYAYGCHSAQPDAPIVGSPIKLLHCHYLGSVDDLIRRYRQLAARQCLRDVRRRLAWHYWLTDEQIRALHRSVSAAAYPFSIIDDVRRRQHGGASFGQIANELQSEMIVPPSGVRAWNAQTVRDVFGATPK